MLLFLPEGVLSITAHDKEACNLTVRALSPDILTKYIKTDVHYDATEGLPYFTFILRPKWQEVLFCLLQRMDYRDLQQAIDDSRYGVLLKQVNHCINFYPEYGVEENPLEEQKAKAPEVARYFCDHGAGKRFGAFCLPVKH